MINAMAAPMLVTKLYAPQVRPDVVPRLRLVETLNDALRLQHRLSLVSAAPGFGKTTLLAEWCGQVQRPTTWLSLDRGDDDGVTFWSHLVAALQASYRAFGESALNLLRSPSPGTSPPVEAVVTALINDLDALAPEQVIILDDYQLITLPALHAGVAFLVDHLPPQTHLVIASRTEPPLPLARWRASNQLTELRTADLSFRADEAAYFLNSVAGLGLSTADVAALEARTEGWITGLRLAVLALPGSASGQIIDALAAFSGNHRYIFDYLAEEVFQQQPANVQSFLLRTSLLDQLTASLCEAVTGESGGQAALENLERANLFVTPLNSERHWYRYQQLFAEFLRERLRRALAEQVPNLHRRASAWYEGQGFVPEAIQHALLAADFELAARLMEQNGMSVWMRGEVGTVLKWLEAVPLEVMYARPRLCLLRARALLWANEVDSADKWAQQAFQALAAEPTEAPELSGNVAALQAFLARVHGDFSRSIELSQKALAQLPSQETLWRCSAASNLGMAYVFSGDEAAAEPFLDQAYTLALAANHSHVAITAAYFLGFVQLRRGRLAAAAEIYRRGLREVTAPAKPRMPILSVLLEGLATVLYEWNDLEAADQYLTEGMALASQGGVVEALLMAYLTLARLRQARRDYAGAQEALEQSAVLGRANLWHLEANQVAQVKLWLAQGQLDAAAQWMARQHAPSLTVARVLLAEGKKEPGHVRLREALEMLSGLIREAEPESRPQPMIELLTLQAEAFQAQGENRQAIQSIGHALTLAEPGGYVRLFVDEGAPVQQLLLQAAAEQRQGRPARFSRDYVERVLAAFDQPGASQPAGLAQPLTTRELQILRCLAAGASNQEIAAKLVITVNTTKKHIANILGKLDAANRTQAVSRARDLGLL
jgi:LuxR family maltose regulon positive regulatory protein